MHKLEFALLKVFQQEPTKALSTSALVEKVMQTSTQEVKDLLQSQDYLQQKSGKVEKARLHRKLLYHINKLVEDGLLQVTGVQGRGEKIFTLVGRKGDIEVVSGKKRIHIHKPTQIHTPIDEVEGAHIFDQAYWTRKVNAILLEALAFERISMLGEHIIRTAEYINDVIGVNHFEELLGTIVAEYELFLQRLLHLEQRVNLRITLRTHEDIKKAMRFCRVFSTKKPENIQLIFCVTPKVLQEQQITTELFGYLIKAGIKIHLQNTALEDVPIITGRLGTYTLPKSSWEEYETQEKRKGIVLCAGTITLEVPKVRPLHKVARKAAQAFFLLDRTRRIQQEELFKLEELDIDTGFFVNYIRLWNFSLEEFEELFAAKEVVDEFSEQQERIYRACGMPIRFQVCFGSSFGKQQGLGQRTYRKTSVKSLQTLQEENFTKYLEQREKTTQFFLSDRVRFFHGKTPESHMIFKESAFILSSYNLSFITFDFSQLQGDVKLTEFLGKRT